MAKLIFTETLITKGSNAGCIKRTYLDNSGKDIIFYEEILEQKNHKFVSSRVRPIPEDLLENFRKTAINLNKIDWVRFLDKKPIKIEVLGKTIILNRRKILLGVVPYISSEILEAFDDNPSFVLSEENNNCYVMGKDPYLDDIYEILVYLKEEHEK